MDGLTLREWVSAIIGGEWARAGVEPPRLTAGDYTVIVRTALREHVRKSENDDGGEVEERPHPLTPRVSKLVEAEGFALMWALIPRRCGATRGRILYVPRGHPPDVLRVLIHHERAHGWIFKRQDTEATEADIWFLTVFFAWPPWLADEDPPPLPEWFLELCRDVHNKIYELGLTGS